MVAASLPVNHQDRFMLTVTKKKKKKIRNCQKPPLGELICSDVGEGHQSSNVVHLPPAVNSV